MTVRAVEGKKPYRGGTAIEVTEDKVINLLLREANNLLQVNGNNELYCDLQLDDELRPTDDFPVGVTTGRIMPDNGWDWQGTILCAKTTSGDNIKLVYTDTGEIWVDNGTGTFKRMYLASEVDEKLALKQNILTAGDGIEIDTGGITVIHSDMQGPCADGFHVPLNTEWQYIYNAGVTLGIWDGTDGMPFSTYLKMPYAGYLNNTDGVVTEQGTSGRYWSSVNRSTYNSWYLTINGTSINPSSNARTGRGETIRAIKDTAVAPDSSWTTIFDGSAIAQGAGIFWNQSEGLISISEDGSNWYTIQDKNVGATTVYEYGDTLSETNCGKYFQRGNNYGFAWNGAITTSSVTVDASIYGPGNYYSDSTFILSSQRWDGPANNNLWGGATQGTWTSEVPGDRATISNTGVLTINNNAPDTNGNIDINEFVPDNQGQTGQVLTKTNNGYEWMPSSGGATNVITVTLTSAGWNNNEQTVTAIGVTASNTVIISPVPANINDYGLNSIYCSVQGTDSLTFTCNTVPSNDIDVSVVIMG